MNVQCYKGPAQIQFRTHRQMPLMMSSTTTETIPHTSEVDSLIDDGKEFKGNTKPKSRIKIISKKDKSGFALTLLLGS